MQLTDNTVLVTGGGSGIGAALAGAFHALGNQVIVSGRDTARLRDMAREFPGMDTVVMDITDTVSIARSVDDVLSRHAGLNVLINNAGILRSDDAGVTLDDEAAVLQLTTDFLGPVRVSSAFMTHLRRQRRAHIVYTTSALAYTPLAPFAIHSAAKAALHSFILSQRFLLKDSRVTVQELVPPWVGTGLIGSTEHPQALPLERFLDGALAGLANDAPEIVVTEARRLRANPGPAEHAYVDQLNRLFLAQSF